MMQAMQIYLRNRQPAISLTQPATRSRAGSRPPPPVAPAAPVVLPVQAPAQRPIRILTEKERLEYFKNFLKSSLPTFQGQIYGTVAEQWVRRMEQIFEAMYVPDCGERVRL